MHSLSRVAATVAGASHKLAMAPRTLCLYHFPCPDGIFAALAVHLAHRAQGVEVEFRPNTVYAPLTVDALQLEGDETAFLADFAGGPGFARQLAGAVPRGRVVVLDHHKTAAAELCGPAAAGELPANLQVHIPMDLSGATVCLRHFRADAGLTPEQAQLFDYIEDADLWKWRLPDSKAFSAGFASLRLDLDAQRNPAIFEQLLQQTPAALIALGKPILAEQRRQVAAAVAASFEVALGGAAGGKLGWGRCLAVRVGQELAGLRSQLGNALAEESQRRGLRAVAAVAYVEPAMSDASQIKVSLRSLGDEDTTVVSQAYGGGGHHNASSCLMPAAEWEAWAAA